MSQEKLHHLLPAEKGSKVQRGIPVTIMMGDTDPVIFYQQLCNLHPPVENRGGEGRHPAIPETAGIGRDARPNQTLGCSHVPPGNRLSEFVAHP